MARIVHGTLVGDEVTTVTLTDRNFEQLEVMNVDGAAVIYFRVDGEDPEVEGDDCEVIPASIAVLRVPTPSVDNEVRLISSGTPKYSVRGI